MRTLLYFLPPIVLSGCALSGETELPSLYQVSPESWAVDFY